MKNIALISGFFASIMAVIFVPIFGVRYAIQISHSPHANVAQIVFGTILLFCMTLGLIPVFHDAMKRASSHAQN